jgi:UDP-N-acetylmuramate--alanine ligase
MKIYCSGIGGIGLSAYAAHQIERGNTVYGSDRGDSVIVQNLRELGAHISLNQDGSHVPSDCDLFVYSEAVPADSPERIRARDFGIPMQSYFHALGELTQDSFLIAICGTHGKSSTTAMVSKMLIDAGKDPSVVVGTRMKELDGNNWRKGKSDLFVVEACEYRKSFHYLSPDIVLMTNVDGDHFDAFASIDDYQAAFVTFLKRLPQDGPVILHGSDADSTTVGEASGRTVIDADAGEDVVTGAPGAHMRQNAKLAAALGEYLGVNRATINNSLATFTGTWRRMEVKGETANGVTIVDDYAHHPVEIRATLQAMREVYPQRRIICVFQPHTHDRTLKLYDEFTAAFSDANLVIIPDVYVARSEIETEAVDVSHFVNDIARISRVDCVNGQGLHETEKFLHERTQKGDVVILMGAGNINTLAPQLLRED